MTLRFFISLSVVTLVLKMTLEVGGCFSEGSRFFPAVTDVFHRGCLACLEEFFFCVS